MLVWERQSAAHCWPGWVLKQGLEIGGGLPDNSDKKRQKAMLSVSYIGRVGVEPTQCLHRRILSPLRLPIPPPRTFPR